MSEPKGSKARYKTTNWAEYNAALKARGSLTIWLDKGMQWYAPSSGKRGRQHIFSNAAIQFCLGIKCLFGLALRQSLGMVESLLHLAGLDWRVPDYSVGPAKFTQPPKPTCSQRFSSPPSPLQAL